MSIFDRSNHRLLVEDIARTVDEIAPVFDKGLKLLPPEAAAETKNWLPARQLLSLGLLSIAWRGAGIDHDISNLEATLSQQLRPRFDPSYNEDQAGLNSRQIRDVLRQHYNEQQPQNIVESLGTVCGVLGMYDRANGSIYAETARSMFLKLANAVLKADGSISPTEQKWLEQFKESLWKDPFVGVAQTSVTVSSEAPASTDVKARTLEEVLSELRSLIGLDRIKREVAELVNFIRVQQLRQARSLPVTPVSHHLVFFGNPGTGKTTIARLMAEVYRCLGVLSKGHLVETDRSGLVAGYVGQTALKVREVTAKALGGVLFVDEAYALGGRDSQDFGHEAIETLLKVMEDRRSDFVVVVAGYPEKMEKFFDSNPGLASRFNRYLRFEDYTPGQLVEIFGRFCEKGGYTLTAGVQAKISGVFAQYYAAKDERFGNARLARNEFERTINAQASRIVRIANIDVATLSTIEADDIAEARESEL
jgi:SpoVK/Ycf46/Vps4 family AAA+-type ATPase